VVFLSFSRSLGPSIVEVGFRGLLLSRVQLWRGEPYFAFSLFDKISPRVHRGPAHLLSTFDRSRMGVGRLAFLPGLSIKKDVEADGAVNLLLFFAARWFSCLGGLPLNDVVSS
jgi:hypothetical protein